MYTNRCYRHRNYFGIPTLFSLYQSVLIISGEREREEKGVVWEISEATSRDGYKKL